MRLSHFQLARFSKVFGRILGGERLSPDEAETVLQIAGLAAEIDLDDDPAKREVLDQLIDRFAQITPSVAHALPVSPVPTDVEERSAEIVALAERLTRQPVRELAYVLAYVLAISDLQLEPIEDALLEELREALDIDPDRADQLIEAGSEDLTPGIGQFTDPDRRGR